MMLLTQQKKPCVPTPVADYTLNRTLTHMLKLCFSRRTANDIPTPAKHYKYNNDININGHVPVSLYL